MSYFRFQFSVQTKIIHIHVNILIFLSEDLEL